MQEHESGKSNLSFFNLKAGGAMSLCLAFCLFSTILLTAATAQETRVINLWPGIAPGSEQWKQSETVLGSGDMQHIINVTTPTLTAYLPDPSAATGTAVIMAPGGGFIFLGMKSEGQDVAKWLVARGIAAFVLKYRTAQLEGQNEAQLNQSGGARFGAQLRNHALIAEDGKYGIADGIQAIKVVRAHAAELGVSPDRIVFMGFSAGGMITEFTAIQADARARPNYAAPIYGAPFPDVPPIPKGLPPFFMAMAQDDTLAGAQIVTFYDALKTAGYRPEFHIYNSGGHGWGMRKQNKTSDHWIDEFYYWLEAQGLTRPVK